MNEILRRIAALLSENDNMGLACNLQSEGSKLWCILTALRGPDNDSIRTKEATTAVIRWKVGIPDDNSGGAAVNPDSEELRDRRKRLSIIGSHFLEHARDAFTVLGMKWDEVNKL